LNLEGDDDGAEDQAEHRVDERAARHRLQLIRRIAGGADERNSREHEPGHEPLQIPSGTI
jgi:hypothetical protein